MPVRIPSKPTLDKYGLSADEFVGMVEAQQGLCAVCKRPLLGHLVNIDHHHVRGWKEKPPVERRRYVRGLLHAMCNRMLLGPTRFGFKPEHFRLAADYLDQWAHLGMPAKSP